jgi:hypothetical protein
MLVYIATESNTPLPELLDMSWSQVNAIGAAITSLKGSQKTEGEVDSDLAASAIRSMASKAKRKGKGKGKNSDIIARNSHGKRVRRRKVDMATLMGLLK